MASNLNVEESGNTSSFTAEFSIHDTILTRSLEIGDFKTATAILNEHFDPTFVNDGPYERFPLYIVLCGKTSEGSDLPRNLQFAKLLLNHGADTNRRVPIYDPLHGIRSSMTPVELLVHFFYSCQKLFAFNRWEDNKPDIIGLDGKMKSSFHDVRHHLLQLLNYFIDSGATLQLPPDESGVSLLSHILWTYPDIELLKRLVQAGVDVNCVDIHLQNATFALCYSFSVHLRKRDLQLLQREVMTYLLQDSSIKVEALNCQYQSALWVAMSVHRFDLAEMLLKAGASDEVLGYSYLAANPLLCQPEIYIAEKVPAIFAPIVSSVTDTVKKSCCSDLESAKIRQSRTESHLSYLIDKGYFNKHIVEESIIKIFCWNEHFKWHKKLLEQLLGKDKLVPRLFGCLSATLAQLCIRKIFKIYFLTKDSLSTKKSKTSPVLFDITEASLNECLERLALPLSFLPGLELELLHQKIFFALKHGVHCWVSCSCAANRLDVETDSDVSTDEGVEATEPIASATVQNVFVLDL